MLVQPEIIGCTQDAKLKYLLQQVSICTLRFIQAIRESSEDHISIEFNAFTLKTEKKMEAEAIFDLIMSASAIEMKQHALDLVTKYTFSTDIHEGDGEYSLYLKCRKEVPEVSLLEG